MPRVGNGACVSKKDGGGEGDVCHGELDSTPSDASITRLDHCVPFDDTTRCLDKARASLH